MTSQCDMTDGLSANSGQMHISKRPNTNKISYDMMVAGVIPSHTDKQHDQACSSHLNTHLCGFVVFHSVFSDIFHVSAVNHHRQTVSPALNRRAVVRLSCSFSVHTAPESRKVQWSPGNPLQSDLWCVRADLG